MFCHKLVIRSAGVVGLFYSQFIFAAGWDIETDISGRVVHNDNVFLTPTNEQGATGAVFGPAIKLNRREADQSLKAAAEFELTRYKDEVQVDRDEGKVDLGWIKKTERSQFMINGEYSQYSSLNQTLETSGITDQPVDILTTTITPSWTYRLGETWHMSLSYSYTDVEYDEPGFPGFDQFKVVNFINYRADSIDISFSKMLSRTDRMYFATSYLQYDGKSSGLQLESVDIFFINTSERELEYDYLEYKLGYAHDFSKTQNISMSFGGNQQDVTNRVRGHLFYPTGEEVAVDFWDIVESSKKGNVYSVDYTREGDVSELALSTGRNRTSDSTGGLVERSFINIRYIYDFSERVRSAVQLNTEERKVDADTSVVRTGDRLRSYATASIRYRLSKEWDFSANYRYVNLDPDTSQADSVSNTIYVTLNWNSKYFL